MTIKEQGFNSTQASLAQIAFVLAELPGGSVHPKLRVWALEQTWGCSNITRDCPHAPASHSSFPSALPPTQQGSYPQWKKALHPGQALDLRENKANKLYGKEASSAFLCPLVSE